MARDSTDVTVMPDQNVPFFTSSRMCLAVLGFFGFINVYALRVNLSVSIVCMVNHTWLQESQPNNVTSSSECSLLDHTANVTDDTHLEPGSLRWDKPLQGIILGSYFWGYTASQVPAGWVATRMGGKRVFGWAMFASGVLTLLIPVLANTSYIALMIVRCAIGFASGMSFPAMHTFWGHWAPPLERTKLTSFTYAGAQVGNVLAFPISGLLCKYGFAGGWPSIYYVFGSLSLVWFVVWMLVVSDTPQQHKRITQAEFQYLNRTLEKDHTIGRKSTEDIPWWSFAKSLPVYAIIISNVTSDWGAYTLLTNIPTYMNEVLKFDITSNGVYSALPYIFFWIIINISAVMADFSRRKVMSTTATLKVFDAFGKLSPALMMIGLGYVDCSQYILAIVLLILAVSLTGFQYSGFLVNHVDIAPQYAGILFGISNGIAAVTGFVSPYVVGVITSENQSRAEWQTVFYISAGVYAFGAIFYIIFASGEKQPWAKIVASEDAHAVNSNSNAIYRKVKGGEEDVMLDNAHA